MKAKKLIVVFSIALVISLSIPHYSLWGFGSIGVEVGYAAANNIDIKLNEEKSVTNGKYLLISKIEKLSTGFEITSHTKNDPAMGIFQIIVFDTYITYECYKTGTNAPIDYRYHERVGATEGKLTINKECDSVVFYSESHSSGSGDVRNPVGSQWYEVKAQTSKTYTCTKTSGQTCESGASCPGGKEPGAGTCETNNVCCKPKSTTTTYTCTQTSGQICEIGVSCPSGKESGSGTCESGKVCCKPTTTNDDSQCTTAKGNCKDISKQDLWTGGYFKQGLCLNVGYNIQCFVTDGSITGCEKCKSIVKKWCANGAKGYCAETSCTLSGYAEKTTCGTTTPTETDPTKIKTCRTCYDNNFIWCYKQKISDGYCNSDFYCDGANGEMPASHTCQDTTSGDSTKTCGSQEGTCKANCDASDTPLASNDCGSKACCKATTITPPITPGLTLCQTCVNIVYPDTHPYQFYCDCSGSYISGCPNGCKQQTLPAKTSTDPSYLLAYNQQVEAQQQQQQQLQSQCTATQGTVIPRGGTCPPPPTCEELCTKSAYSGSSSYISSTVSAQNIQIPFGQCYAKGQNPMSINYNILTQNTAAQSTSAPRYTPMSGETSDCTPSNQNCWCTYVSSSSVTANQNYPSPTIPGTGSTANWKDPKEIKNPSVGSPNDYTGKPSGGNVGADISQQMVVAGTSLTISGNIIKQCSECNGFERTCEKFQELTCKKTENPIWTTLSYKDCPNDLPDVLHEEGDGTKISIGGILMSLATIAMMAGGLGAFTLTPQLIALFSSAGGLGQTLKSSGLAVDKPSVTGMATAPDADCKAAGGECKVTCTDGTSINVACLAGGVCCKPSTTTTTDGGGLTPQEIQAMQAALNMMASSIPKQESQPCFRVCGEQYNSTVGYNPLCHEGGVVIAFKNATYECSKGACGAWTSKKIKIELRGPSGNVVMTDTTTTDANGHYSYTFNAPNADGQFTALVVVPLEK
jgi:hypothetical protein